MAKDKERSSLLTGYSDYYHRRMLQESRQDHQRNMQSDRHSHDKFRLNLDDQRKRRELEAKLGDLNSQKRIDELVAAGVLTYKNGKLCEGKNAGVAHKYDRMTGGYSPVKAEKQRIDTYREFEESQKKKKKRKLFW